MSMTEYGFTFIGATGFTGSATMSVAFSAPFSCPGTQRRHIIKCEVWGTAGQAPRPPARPSCTPFGIQREHPDSPSCALSQGRVGFLPDPARPSKGTPNQVQPSIIGNTAGPPASTARQAVHHQGAVGLPARQAVHSPGVQQDPPPRPSHVPSGV